MPNTGDSWRALPSTPAQRDVIRRKGLAPDDEARSFTRGYAASLISASVNKAGFKKSDEPTQPQIDLITKLAQGLGDDPATHLEGLTRRGVSILLDQLKARTKTEIRLQPGFYVLDDQIYRVKEGSLGRLWAARLVKLPQPEDASNGYRTHAFKHEAGAVLLLKPEHLMTREQGIKFGQETSSCVRCATPLDPTIKNKDGSPRWIGPRCEREMGW